MDALAAARKVLAARVNDPKARFIPGLADDLRAVLGAFDEIDRRTDALAAGLLRVLMYGAGTHATTRAIDLRAAQLKNIGAMGPESAAVLRLIEHGQRCTCQECMPAEVRKK